MQTYRRLLAGALLVFLSGCRQPASTPPSGADEIATLNALATAIQQTESPAEPEPPAETVGAPTAPLPTPDPLTVALAQTATAVALNTPVALTTPVATPEPQPSPTVPAPTVSPTVSDADAAVDLACRETLTRFFVFKAGDSRQALELLFVPHSLPLPDDPPGMIIRGRVLLDLQPAPDTVEPVAAGERIYYVRFSVDYDPASSLVVPNPREALAYLAVDLTGLCLIRTFTALP